MLTKVKKAEANGGHGLRFAIVASRYNAEYVDSMLSAAEAVLRDAGAVEVQVIRVPGAYEVPLAAARLARKSASKAVGGQGARGGVSAVICLGVILRGETTHAAHIGEAVSRTLMELQIRYEIPMIHEVLLLENQDQARVRCLDPEHNRGKEAAQTALAMAGLMRRL